MHVVRHIMSLDISCRKIWPRGSCRDMPALAADGKSRLQHCTFPTSEGYDSGLTASYLLCIPASEIIDASKHGPNQLNHGICTASIRLVGQSDAATPRPTDHSSRHKAATKTMSTASSAAALSPSSPTKTSRQVYQVSRSITERLPGSSSSSSKQPHTHTHTSHHHHNSLTHHISASLHRRERSRDGRVSGSAAAHTAVPAVLQQGQYVTPRGSLEVARSAGVLTPKSLSPYQSRRGSVLLAAGAGGDGAAITVPVLSKEEAMSREKQRTKAGTAYVFFLNPPLICLVPWFTTAILTCPLWPSLVA